MNNLIDLQNRLGTLKNKLEENISQHLELMEKINDINEEILFELGDDDEFYFCDALYEGLLNIQKYEH